MADSARVDKVVIVGAGLAGGNAAVTLREDGFRGRVVLIGTEADCPYGRPPLSKTYLRGEEDLSGWYVKPMEWYASNDVELLLETTVQQVDVERQELRLHNGEGIPYDRLVLAAGGRARHPRVPGADLEGVQFLRTTADCDAIKRAARPGAAVVVVGMGFIGSEVAASLRQLGLSVTAVLSDASPLETVLGKEVGAVMTGIHRDHGVNLIPDDRVTGFEGDGAVERVVTEGGRRIDCQLAVVGAGIEPNIEMFTSTPIAIENGILVDARCQTSAGNVYAAGDVANHLHPLFGRVRVEHYNSAEKMGRFVAQSLLGDDRPFGYVHTFWSDQYEHKLEYVGHATSWDSFTLRGSLEARNFIGFYQEGGLLKAAVGLNRGGDPELEEESELHACQRLIGERRRISSKLLTDERVHLQQLANDR
jgi:3-phenylpropionate/trans-cinnamate dioxygenase ferredoxin reductase subunit